MNERIDCWIFCVLIASNSFKFDFQKRSSRKQTSWQCVRQVWCANKTPRKQTNWKQFNIVRIGCHNCCHKVLCSHIFLDDLFVFVPPRSVTSIYFHSLLPFQTTNRMSFILRLEVLSTDSLQLTLRPCQFFGRTSFQH